MNELREPVYNTSLCLPLKCIEMLDREAERLGGVSRSRAAVEIMRKAMRSDFRSQRRAGKEGAE